MWALPVSALMHLGDRTILHVGEKTFCWTYKDGHAKRIEVETGSSATAIPERRPVDRGHQSPASRARRRHRGGPLDADRRDGAGDPGRPVDPRRRPPCDGRESTRRTEKVASHGVPTVERSPIQRVAGGGPLPTAGR